MNSSFAAPRPMVLLMILFFLSGAAALIYEVLWLKDLSRLFGVSAYATSATLSAFFLGIALGSYYWGKRVAANQSPLRLYALLELGIAASALLYFGLFAVYRLLYRGLFDFVDGSDLTWLSLKFLLALVILVPPAFFMGGTVPVMGHFLAPRAALLGRRVSLLYAVNTFGAALGAFLAGFYLPPLLGFRGSYFVALALNLLIAAVAYALGGRRVESAIAAESAIAPPAPTIANSTNPIPHSAILILAFFSGLLMLSLEVLWTHMFSQVLHNTVYSFAVILTVFLVALAFGSIVAHWLARTSKSTAIPLSVLLALSAALIALNPLLFSGLTDHLKAFAPDAGWSSYVLGAFWLGAAVMLLPGVVAGAVFPYLLRVYEPYSRQSGQSIGRLITLNTVGSILGSALAGFVILTALGLWNSLRTVAFVYGVLGLLTALAQYPRRFRLVWLPLVAVFGMLFLSYSDLARIDLDESLGEKPVWLREGRHGTVAVVDRGGDLRLRVNNSYLLGTSQSAPNLRLQSLIPLALHPNPKSIFYLGMGTGITASGAIPTAVKTIVITELNPDVITADRQYYGPWLNQLFTDPRVRIVAEDGRNYLYAASERFDLIISDIFLTHWAGAGDLYALEHYQAAADRLNDEGLYVQWLPMFELTVREFDVIAATMARVFPQLTLWRRGFSPNFTIAALIGHKQITPLDAERYIQSAAELVQMNSFSEDLWFNHIPLAAYMGNLSPDRVDYSPVPINTDNRPIIEFLAPRVERESRGSKSVATLAWFEMVDFSDTILRRVPTAADPFLAATPDSLRRQAMAGLAYFHYSVNERTGNQSAAQRNLDEYSRRLNPEIQ